MIPFRHQPLPHPVLEVFERARVLAGEDKATEITVHHVEAALSQPERRPYDRHTPIPDMPFSAEAKRVLKETAASASARESVTVDHLRAVLARETNGI